MWACVCFVIWKYDSTCSIFLFPFLFLVFAFDSLRPSWKNSYCIAQGARLFNNSPKKERKKLISQVSWIRRRSKSRRSSRQQLGACGVRALMFAYNFWARIWNDKTPLRITVVCARNALCPICMLFQCLLIPCKCGVSCSVCWTDRTSAGLTIFGSRQF